MMNPYSAQAGNSVGERAEVSRRHSSPGLRDEGQNAERRKWHSISFETALSPTRMSRYGRIVERDRLK